MRDLLKFITCGSVDDGKSTLIGHILYDAKLLYADQKRALALESKVGSRGGELDYSLLLDGLTEEREQGITIDVAYRYFNTQARSFIVADTPGHEEYTRNMAVGASFADLAVILVDVSKGVLSQTRRHARICAIMGIRHFVFAVNKMDLVSYSQEVFTKIRRQIIELGRELDLEELVVIPVSATEGDNVTCQSAHMPWYEGKALLTWLEQVDVEDEQEEKGFYLPVQRVCRPDQSFRGFQGQIESGTVSVGEEITVLPGSEKARVKKILSGEKNLETAVAGQAVTLSLDREIDISRGSVLTREAGLNTADSITATLIWMDDKPLSEGGNYYIKLGTRMISGVVSRILYTIDINSGAFRNGKRVNKNEIAVCRLSLTGRIVLDRFKSHRSLGELILIDRISFMTSGCGVVDQYDVNDSLLEQKISPKTRSALMGQRAVTVIFRRDRGFTRELLERTEKELVMEGRHTYLLEADADCTGGLLWPITSHLNQAGIIVLLLTESGGGSEKTYDGFSRLVNYSVEDQEVGRIVSFVKKISSYDYEVSNAAQYI